VNVITKSFTIASRHTSAQCPNRVKPLKVDAPSSTRSWVVSNSRYQGCPRPPSSLNFGMVRTGILHLLACRLLASLPASAHLCQVSVLHHTHESSSSLSPIHIILPSLFNPLGTPQVILPQMPVRSHPASLEKHLPMYYEPNVFTMYA